MPGGDARKRVRSVPCDNRENDEQDEQDDGAPSSPERTVCP